MEAARVCPYFAVKKLWHCMQAIWRDLSLLFSICFTWSRRTFSAGMIAVFMMVIDSAWPR